MNRKSRRYPLFLSLGAAVILGLLSVQGDPDVEEDGTRKKAELAALGNSAEGDTAAETLHTLIAQVDGLANHLQSLRRADQAAAETAAKRQQTAERQLRLLEERLAATEQHLQKQLQKKAPGGEKPQEPLKKIREAAYRSVQPLDAPQASRTAATGPVEPLVPRPVYTIPPNAILFDAVALTALVGRVPVGGQVTDPLPVKVLAGNDNLAASGHVIPGLSGMMFSGTAVGDWTLRCVSVRLHDATFIFADGTVRYMTAGGLPGSEAGTTLGWLSNEQGMPCIPGQLLSTAGWEAAQRVLLSAARGYAGARGESEITEIISSQSDILRSLTGNAQDYASNSAVESALAELENFAAERDSGGFDAVYVPPGSRVAVHITQQLEINYAPGGRKIEHAATAAAPIAGLD